MLLGANWGSSLLILSGKPSLRALLNQPRHRLVRQESLLGRLCVALDLAQRSVLSERFAADLGEARIRQFYQSQPQHRRDHPARRCGCARSARSARWRRLRPYTRRRPISTPAAIKPFGPAGISPPTWIPLAPRATTAIVRPSWGNVRRIADSPRLVRTTLKFGSSLAGQLLSISVATGNLWSSTRGWGVDVPATERTQ